jgi:hypothetical protein
MMLPGYTHLYQHSNPQMSFGHQAHNPSYMMHPQQRLPVYSSAAGPNPYFIPYSSAMQMHRGTVKHPQQYVNAVNNDAAKTGQQSNAMKYSDREFQHKFERPMHHNGGHAQQIARKPKSFAESDSEYSLDIASIESGVDKRTTIMVSNSH